MRRRDDFVKAFKAYLGIKDEEDELNQEELAIQNEWSPIKVDLFDYSEVEIIEDEEKVEEVEIGRSDL